jgi:outer membrane protein assembly factor BamD (BamD/ComL family)
MPAPAAAPPQIQKQEEQEQEKQEQAPATPAPTPSSTEAETWLIRKGVAALHAGDPARALALFDEHARHFPDGLLAEERAAERIIALHDLGRDAEARAAATAFLRAHPGSPQAERVRAACDMPPNQ